MLEIENKKIIRNSAKCRLCNDEIESKYRWDYVTCKCGEIFVDGGKDYLRRGAADGANFIDTSLPKTDKAEPKRPRILLWDVETSLTVVTTFTLTPKFIHPDNILEDWYIICGAWKFLGEDTIHNASIYSETDTNRSDYEVVKKLRDAVLEADIIVHHNGDKFDIKKLNTRLAYHRLDPLPTKLTTVDTYKEAKRTFAFTSNSLDYLGRYLGVGRKLKTSPDLWRNVLKDDADALIEMAEYNKQDVILLEDVYTVLRPYIRHPNVAAFAKNDSLCCTLCQSTKIQSRGYYDTTAGIKRKYSCMSCGKWGHEPKLEFTTQLRAA